jgi:ATP-dependent DNA helicase RecQ
MAEGGVETDLKACLRKYWGYTQFFEGQLDICLNILRSKDSFVIMATGSGKSLTFQLPAVYLREKGIRATTIVVSPLISLIDDQVSALLAMGIPSCAVGSNSSPDIEARAMRGEFTIVYATPEKLLTWQHGLRSVMSVAHIACFAVDESHCVSEWGHDFRPDYRRLGELRDILGFKIPWVGLTASATVAVQADIVRNLRLVRPLVAKASLNRPNLKYCVINRTNSNDLLRLIHEYRKEQLLAYPGSVNKATVPFYSTLIYVNSKKETEDLAKLLVDCKLLAGIKVAYYHAGMQPQDRSAVHMAFSKDEVQVVIATVAFGMGRSTVPLSRLRHKRHLQYRIVFVLQE